MAKTTIIVPPGHVLIFRPWRVGNDGRRIYAATYGFKAWPLLVRK